MVRASLSYSICSSLDCLRRDAEQLPFHKVSRASLERFTRVGYKLREQLVWDEPVSLPESSELRLLALARFPFDLSDAVVSSIGRRNR